MYGSDRAQLRQQFFDVWQKVQRNSVLSPLELQVAQVIDRHKEYHGILKNPEANLNKDYFPELGDTNPFLHMSLHIALHEQLSTQRPAGIRAFYQEAVKKFNSEHEAQHCLMNALAECMWQAQQLRRPPSDAQYIEAIKKHLN